MKYRTFYWLIFAISDFIGKELIFLRQIIKYCTNIIVFFVVLSNRNSTDDPGQRNLNLILVLMFFCQK